MVFYTATRAYWDGDLPLIFDGDRLTNSINERFSTWLSWPLPLHPWLYPPHFLLYLLPFGLIPPASSCALFLLSGLVLLVAAIRSVVRGGRQRFVHVASLALCPATAITVCLGQNAFLSSALLVAGLGLAGRRPLLGGALLGALSFKPQLCLLAPVALAAARQWRALISAITAGLLLAAISLMILGGEPWRAWIDLITGSNPVYERWVAIGRLNGQSVYTCAALLGASRELANLIQGLACLLAAGSVYRIFRRRAPLGLKIAVILAATTLAAPHIIAYDLLMLAIAASLVFCDAFEKELRPAEAIIIVAAWLMPLFNPPSVFWPGLFTPVVISLLIGCAMLRAAGVSSMEHPAHRLNEAPERRAEKSGPIS